MEWWIWLIIGLAIVAIVAVLVIASRQRRARLQDQFGSEYDRTVVDADSRRQAEGDLRGRLKRHRELELRPLAPDAAEKYSQEWLVIQARFVDAPDEACTRGERLLEQVLRDRGYPVDEDFDTQADLVSVDHPELVGDYRRAHDMLHSQNDGDRRLDELRAVFLVHRDLFSDLLDNGVERVEHDDETDLTQSTPQDAPTRDDVRR
jgi:hypothetical protein